MLPSVTADDGRRFERWCTYGSGTMAEETARWYLTELSQFLYDGGCAQKSHDDMTICLKQFKEETILKARRWKDSMAQSFWMFCAEGNGKKVRQAQRGAAAQSSARHVVDRYNKFRREGKISAEGGGRVKAYEKEVLQNLAIWLARGASHFSAEDMHAAFLKQLDPLQQEKIPVELHALGLEYCKFMYEKRPQNTHKHIINNRGTLAEAVAINDVNAFARHVWPTADKVRKMLFGVLQESLDAPDCPVRATSAHQGAAQEDAIKLSYARWITSGCPEEVPVDPTCMTEADGVWMLDLFKGITAECQNADGGGGVQYPYMVLACEFEVQKDTSSQAGGWLRGNREGIEILIDTSKSLLDLVKNRVAEDRERQKSKFGRVKPLWVIETKEDGSAAAAADLAAFDKQDIRADSQKRGKRGGDD